MSALLDRIKAHADPEKVRRIEVPEWGEPAELDAAGQEKTPGKPLVITYTMPTLGDMALVQKVAPDNPVRQEAELVCLKARDEAGKPMFKRIDAVTLMESAAPEVVHRIASEMVSRQSAEEMEKN